MIQHTSLELVRKTSRRWPETNWIYSWNWSPLNILVIQSISEAVYKVLNHILQTRGLKPSYVLDSSFSHLRLPSAFFSHCAYWLVIYDSNLSNRELHLVILAFVLLRFVRNWLVNLSEAAKVDHLKSFCWNCEILKWLKLTSWSCKKVFAAFLSSVFSFVFKITRKTKKQILFLCMI